MKRKKSTYFRKPRLCSECGQVRIPETRTLCRNCYAKQRRKTAPKKLCRICNKLKFIQGRGVCNSCYKKAYQPKLECQKCKKVTVITGNNLCNSCYQAPQQECKECLRVLPHYAREYCRSCYERWLRGREIICDKCNQKRLNAGRGRCIRCIRIYGQGELTPPKPHVKKMDTCLGCGDWAEICAKGLCHNCYYNQSRFPLDYLRGTLNSAWAKRLLSRFYHYLELQGYSGYRSYHFSRKFAAFINRDGAGNQADFCKDLISSCHNTLTHKGHLSGPDTIFCRFLKYTRLTYGVNLPASGYLGCCVSLIEQTPKSLQAELNFFLHLRQEERGYRKQTGERSAAEKSIYQTIRLLCSWASWMGENGLCSWQQLTVDRFRQRIRQMGLTGKNSEINRHLGLLRSMFTELMLHGRISSIPLKKIHLPRVELTQYSIAGESVIKWFKTLNEGDLNPITKAIGYLVLLHGLRVKEMAALRLGDFDLRRKTLYVYRRHLKISLDPLTFDALKNYLKLRPKTRKNHHLFINKHTRLRETPAAPSFFDKQLNTIGSMKSRPVQQKLIRQFVEYHGVEVAARYFSLSIDTVNKHICHQGILLQKENQVHTKFIQDYV